jgi:phosphoenolpyruvate-protein kinase (PTS system EI component)
MHPATLLEVKEIINKTNIGELSELTKEALMQKDKI